MTPAERRSTVNRVRARLKRRPRTVELQHVADKSGLGIPWLKSFVRGIYAEPDMSFVERCDKALALLEAEQDA